MKNSSESLKCKKSKIYIATVTDGELLVKLDWFKRKVVELERQLSDCSNNPQTSSLILQQLKDATGSLMEVRRQLEEVNYVCNQSKFLT